MADGTVLTTEQGTGEPGATTNQNADDKSATGAPQDQGKPAAEGDQSKTSGAEGDADKGATGAPEAYADFAMPEGMTIDTAMLEQALPVFKELGLTQEQAQRLVNLQAAYVRASSQSQVDSFNQLKQDWLTQAQANKELVGTDGKGFNATVADAKIFLDKLGTPELKTLLNDYGVGNHPEIIRAFARAGKLLKEDNPGTTGSAAGDTPKNKTEARIKNLYGDK